MDNQSNRTNGWNSIFASGWTINKPTGITTFLLLSLPTTPGKMKPQGRHLLKFSWATLQEQKSFDITSSIPMVALRLRDWKKAREEAQRLMIKAQKKWSQRKTLDWTFKIGDKVWLEGRNLHLDCPSIKLSPKRHGPFKVKKVLSPITYQLDLPIQWKIHDVFHIDLLTPYQETDFHGPNFAQPPPDLINGEEEYEVEQILNARRHGRGRKVQYLIKWKGYPDLDNQWVDWNDLHAEEALKDFQKRQPHAPTHIRRAEEGNETAEPLMNSNVNSSPPLTTPQESSRLPSKVAEAFLSWWPTVPSSWVTPPGSDSAGTPNLPRSDDGSPIRQDYYIPQMLIYTPDNLHLHAAHTPYSAPTTLDTEDTHNHTSADSFPCPTPELIPLTNTNPIPIPLCPVTEHPVGPLPLDSWAHEQPSLPLPNPLSLQEAEEAQANTGGEVLTGAAGTDGSADAWEDANQGVTWADYRLPPAKGFVLNDGLDYVPFNIHLLNGDYKPAKYIKIRWGEDPLIYGMIDGDPHQYVVTFEWNVQLDLSRRAVTKSFHLLVMELLLQVLCQSTGTVTVRVICGDRGHGRYPRHTRCSRGVCRFRATDTRLTQELRLRVWGRYCYSLK